MTQGMMAIDGGGSGAEDSLFTRAISSCQKCGRLSAYLDGFARNSGTAEQDYWARPVPGFGDLSARLLIIGLAPGAHGANRTGRPFTGDAAGVLLYAALHKHGFASLPGARDRGDGLLLRDAYITNAVKCAPPGNRPSGPEKAACLDWLAQEIDALRHTKVVLAMGKDAFDAYVRLLRRVRPTIRAKDYRFAHGKSYWFPSDPVRLMSTYHFSRYNVNTGLLTQEMVDRLFTDVVRNIRGTGRDR